MADTSSGYDLTFDMDDDPPPQESVSRKRARRSTLSGDSSDGEEVKRPIKKYSKKARVGLDLCSVTKNNVFAFRPVEGMHCQLRYVFPTRLSVCVIKGIHQLVACCRQAVNKPCKYEV
jgi:hypothetical protein